MTSPWIVPLKRSKTPKKTILAHHFAGGSASVFQSWIKYLPNEVDLLAIELPGRWQRIHEPFMTDIDSTVEQIHSNLFETLAGDYILLGYSLGALIAFELAHRIQAQGGCKPKHLIVLSRNAAHFKSKLPHIHGLSDENFIVELEKRYGGLPSLIRNDPEIRELFLPIMKADFRLFESYEFKQRRPLEVPITACRGISDPVVTAEGQNPWSELTNGPFQLAQFPGGHFFVDQSAKEFSNLLSSIVNHA